MNMAREIVDGVTVNEKEYRLIVQLGREPQGIALKDKSYGRNPKCETMSKH